MSEFPKALNFKLILDEIRYSYIKKKSVTQPTQDAKTALFGSL